MGGGGDRAKQDDWLKDALNVPAERFRTPAATGTAAAKADTTPAPGAVGANKPFGEVSHPKAHSSNVYDKDYNPYYDPDTPVDPPEPRPDPDTGEVPDDPYGRGHGHPPPPPNDPLVEMNTPFGAMMYPKSRLRTAGRAWFEVMKLLEQGKTWSETYARQVTLLELPVRPMRAYIDAPEKAEEEITKAAPDEAVKLAETAENARNVLGLIDPLRVSIETLLQTALSEMKQANLQLDAAKKERKAIDLREEGENLERELDLAAEGFKAVVEVAVEGPEGAIKAITGLAAGLSQALQRNQLLERADKLEKDAIGLHERALDETLHNAVAALGQIEPQIDKLNSISGRIQNAAPRQTRRATDAFDECKCDFKFSRVTTAADAVRTTYEAALNEAKNWNSANDRIAEYINDNKNHYDVMRNRAVLDTMRHEIHNHPKESNQHVADMRALLDKLNALYDRAFEALTKAPGIKSRGG
jgi:hypothetical protein